jgi:hypothetical protein
MRHLPHSIRRRLKRRRFARHARHAEALAYQCAPVWTWSRIRRLNHASHVWEPHPDGPRHR